MDSLAGVTPPAFTPNPTRSRVEQMRMKIAAVTGVVAAVSATAAYASPIAPHGGTAGAPAASAHVVVLPDARRARVPSEVGKNHQAAQDDLQAHGFFNLRERDCTGRGRLLLFDRNWRVVRQSPRAGSRVSTNRAITLCSVKYSD
jgi:hypothetical protein